MLRAKRSLKLAKQYIQQVKLTAQKTRCFTQQKLADELGICRATVSKFFNGQPIDQENFITICDALKLNWQEVADFEDFNYSDCSNENHSSVPTTDKNYLPHYIERPFIEIRCLESIENSGSMTRIKASKGMGKTALIKYLQSQINPKDYRSLKLDFNLAENGSLQDMQGFLYWFCGGVCKELRIDNKLDEYWEEDMKTYSCTMFFEEYILGQFDEPLALFLDNVDRLFDTQEIHEQITKDFFLMLRAWHEKSTSRAIWNNLRMILSYSTEDYSLLDINCSPFNVGVMIELPEFTLEQVQSLAKCQKLTLDVTELKGLLEMVGGHPKLVQRTFTILKNKDFSLKEILENAYTDAGIYKKHLLECLRNLKKHPKLGEAMKKIVETKSSVKLDSILVFKLQSLGLIKIEGNNVKARCNLYYLYFKDRL